MKQFLLFLAILYASFITTEAQTITWTGAGDGTNWSDSSNWDLLHIPTTSNDVIVPDGSTLTIDTSASTKSIEVQGTSVITIEDNLSMANPSSFGENTVINWHYGSLGGEGSLTNNGTINSDRPTPSFNSPGIIGPNFSFNNEGAINLINGNFQIQWNAVLNNQVSGIIDLGEVEFGITGGLESYGVLNNYGLIRKTQGNGVTQNPILVRNYGVIEAMSGVIKFGDIDDTSYMNLHNEIDGVVKGTSTVELGGVNFSNGGTFQPGASPGTLTVIGDFTSSASAKLAIELNGLTQGTEYDLLAIQGNAIFNGIVDIAMGFEGNINDEFIVATTTGTITTCNLAPTATASYGGIQYNFSVTCRNSNEVVLTVTEVLNDNTFEIMEKDILLYPNPTNGIVTLRNNSSTPLLSAKIYDISGRLMATFDLIEMNQDKSLSLINFTSGHYFVMIRAENAIITKRLVKL